MDVYYIPIVGMIKGVLDYYSAAKLHHVCYEKYMANPTVSGGCWEEYHATFDACSNAYVGIASTVVFVLLVSVAMKIIAKRSH